MEQNITKDQKNNEAADFGRSNGTEGFQLQNITTNELMPFTRHVSVASSTISKRSGEDDTDAARVDNVLFVWNPKILT